MSQERLAELIGVTFQQVQKYEKGVNRIAASRLFDLAAALDMPVARFFEGLVSKGANPPAEPSRSQNMLATPEGIELIALFASIKSRQVRRRVVDLVTALVKGE
jgi:transcriptional regulator with XRE-family HTH domain